MEFGVKGIGVMVEGRVYGIGFRLGTAPPQ